ncbi:unnamed protein product [marine sediment metagenome]|uniref:Uncharacterized protein n=1 Tax=marine sediment metagenome TaxID=412755 RepID=X1N1L5_9ZZZZ
MSYKYKVDKLYKYKQVMCHLMNKPEIKLNIMKKIKLIIITSLICFTLNANPIIVPFPPIIHEIYFDSSENWTIEFNTSFYEYIDFDALTIETSSGTSAFKPEIKLNIMKKIKLIIINSNYSYIITIRIDV